MPSSPAVVLHTSLSPAVTTTVAPAVALPLSGVSVAGRGTLVRDPHLIDEMWDDMVAGHFEGGKEDPEVALLHVRAESAEYWDTPGGKVTALLDFVKSKVTGKPMSGENAATEL